MRMSITARTARWMGRIATVGAVALLLAGAAAPAAAMPRRAELAWKHCESKWGDPYYFEFMGVWAVHCELPVEVTTSTDG